MIDDTKSDCRLVWIKSNAKNLSSTTLKMEYDAFFVMDSATSVIYCFESELKYMEFALTHSEYIDNATSGGSYDVVYVISSSVLFGRLCPTAQSYVSTSDPKRFNQILGCEGVIDIAPDSALIVFTDMNRMDIFKESFPELIPMGS